jgi:NADH:ubiquinone oxidoreductase subunit 2 (subunit N)
MNRVVFTPLKRLGRRLDFLRTANVLLYVAPLYGIGLVVQALHYKLPAAVQEWLPEAFAFIALLMVLKAFSERHHPRLAWLLVTLHHAWIALAVTFNEHLNSADLTLHLSGVFVSGAAGFGLLLWLKRREPGLFDLNRYYGHVYEHPRLALAFLVASLGLMGFPITSTFIGEDILFSHIHQDQFWLALFHALCFILGGIALIRMYARLFLGPHAKTYHETTLPAA